MEETFLDRLLKKGLQRPESAALTYESITETYASLRDKVRRACAKYQAKQKCLVFFFIDNCIDDVINFLAALEAGHCVALLNKSVDSSALRTLISDYEPDYIYVNSLHSNELRVSLSLNDDVIDLGDGLLRRSKVSTKSVHSENFILLSTSGSTGTPKFVRLSELNILENSRQISIALELNQSEYAVAHLSLYYSFGLSVLLSHLYSGAKCLLIQDAFTDKVFWDKIRREKCTSLSGVPFHYEMLRRLNLDKLDVPSIKTLTQAGGRLAPKFIEFFSSLMASRSGEFFVMYGQTEASPRMSTLPSKEVGLHLGSVGYALDGGRFGIHSENGEYLRANEPGEVVYYGPNVMLGYAYGRSDLSKSDECKSVLRTGDLGYLDEDGRLFITGRASRIGKVVGVRINLDEVEAIIPITPCAVVEVQSKLYVFVVAKLDSDDVRLLRLNIAEKLSLHPSYVQLCMIDDIPLTSNNKVDYKALVGGLND